MKEIKGRHIPEDKLDQFILTMSMVYKKEPADNTYGFIAMFHVGTNEDYQSIFIGMDNEVLTNNLHQDVIDNISDIMDSLED